MQLEALPVTTLPAALAPDWRRLQAATSGPTFQQDFECAAAWVRHLRGAWQPFLLVARERGEVRGIVPLMYRDDRRRGILPYRRLRFLGQGVTDFSAALAGAADAPALARALLDWLAAGELRWEELALADLLEGGPFLDALRQELRARGVRHEASAGAVYHVDLARPWPEVMAETSRRFVRKNVNLARNRLDRAGPWTAGAEPDLDPERIVALAGPLHAARQASLGRASLFTDPAARRFLLEVLAHHRERGRLRTYWLRREERPVAYMVGLEVDGAYYAWNMAYDPAEAYFYPSRLLLHEILRDCHARGLRELSFMRGESEYKTKWTSRHRLHAKLVVRNRATIYGKALAALESALPRPRAAATP